ncbi:MAG: hypothetical protein WC088_05320 [Candidatus Izemoplasmatales bacterium]
MVLRPVQDENVYCPIEDTFAGILTTDRFELKVKTPVPMVIKVNGNVTFVHGKLRKASLQIMVIPSGIVRLIKEIQHNKTSLIIAGFFWIFLDLPFYGSSIWSASRCTKKLLCLPIKLFHKKV